MFKTTVKLTLYCKSLTKDTNWETYCNGRKILQIGKRTKILIDVRQHNYFIIRGYMFRPFKQTSTGLLTDSVKRCCLRVGIPICLHR